MNTNKQHIMALFNAGKLSTADAEWYTSQGYFLICESGKVVDIVKED